MNKFLIYIITLCYFHNDKSNLKIKRKGVKTIIILVNETRTIMFPITIILLNNNKYIFFLQDGG